MVGVNKFRVLYDYCQTLTPKIKRNDICKKVIEVAGKGNFRVMKTDLDTSIIRGYFLSASNQENAFVKQHGCNVVVLARGLNDCWERFVQVKEVLHLLDDESELTDSKDKFGNLLSELAVPSAQLDTSRVTINDYIAIWKAVMCLCPDRNRLEFADQLEKGQIDHYGIALQLKIPQLYVQLLFRPEYQTARTLILRDH